MERKEGEKSSIAHCLVSDHRIWSRAIQEGREHGGASTEMPDGHLRPPKDDACTTRREREVEYCRPCVTHAPTVFEEK